MKTWLIMICAATLAMAAVKAAEEPLPTVPGIKLEELRLKSSVDGKEQPIIVGVPDGYDAAKPTPLLVGVHTWSATYTLYAKPLAYPCAKRNWLLVLPNFRGPNTSGNPAAREAGGSLLAQHDIIDAIKYMQEKYNVDASRLYAMGASGGGHMSLLMATKYPDLWAGVSSWCPITSMLDWHEQPGNGYSRHIEAITGGQPGASAEVDFEYLRRSPRTFITNAANTAVFIGHGDKDSVIDYCQTVKTYQTLRTIPHRAEFYSWTGGHQMLNERALDWLSQQVKPTAPPLAQHLVTDEGKWYFWAYLEPATPLTLARCDAVLTPAAAAADDKPTQAVALSLTAEQCGLVRVRLADFGLGAVKVASCGGQALAPEAYALKDGVLELKPAVLQRSEYRFEF
ncbi:MAG: alpha/beta hydrolase family protein [Armatimonadota bacterium]